MEAAKLGCSRDIPLLAERRRQPGPSPFALTEGVLVVDASSAMASSRCPLTRSKHGRQGTCGIKTGCGETWQQP